MWPRDYGANAFDIWKKEGRQAAIDYIRENCPEEWRKLAFTHTVNWMGLYRAKTNTRDIKT